LDLSLQIRVVRAQRHSIGKQHGTKGHGKSDCV
jgi:hypothetical protein